MNTYLVKMKVQDGENDYEECYSIDAPSQRKAEIQVAKYVKLSNSFTREYELQWVQRVTRKEEVILRKFGVI